MNLMVYLLELLVQSVHQLGQLRLLVGSLVGVDNAFFGGLVERAGAFAQQSCGGGGITGCHSSAELLFNSLESAFTGAVAGVLLAAGAHPFDCGLQMCHLFVKPFLCVASRSSAVRQLI